VCDTASPRIFGSVWASRVSRESVILDREPDVGYDTKLEQSIHLANEITSTLATPSNGNSPTRNAIWTCSENLCYFLEGLGFGFTFVLFEGFMFYCFYLAVARSCSHSHEVWDLGRPQSEKNETVGRISFSLSKK